MSWSLTRPNVVLRVTKFAPDIHRQIYDKAVRSRALTEAIEAHKQRRAREQQKVVP